MSARPTPQTLDPLGGLVARYFALATSALAVACVATMLLIFRSEIVVPVLQLGALSAFVAAVLVNIIGVDPRFFPFGVWQHLLLHVTMVLACALDAASRAPGLGQSGAWGPIALTVLIVLMGSFRPAGEIVLFTVLSSIAVGYIAWHHSTGLSQLDTVDAILRDVTPLIAVGAGAAGFSRVLVTRVTTWQQHNATLLATSLGEIRSAEEAEVMRQRAELIDYRVGPYLEQILEADLLTPVDIARARGLATTLRTMMVRDATRSWLADLVDELEDPAHLVESLGAEQRRGISAVVAELRASDELVVGSLQARIRSGTPSTLWISGGLQADRRFALRPAAYRAVLRSVFPRARVDVADDRVEITVVLQRTSQPPSTGRTTPVT